MKKKIFLIAAILIPMLYLNCIADESQYRELIGKEFKSLKELPSLSGFSSFGNILASEYNPLPKTYYRLLDLRNDSVGLLILIKYESNSTGRIAHIADLVEVEKMNKTNFIGYGGNCRYKSKRDYGIIAFFKIEDNKTEVFSTIYKAWRIETKKGKINEISIKGIDCLNSEYKADSGGK